MRSKKIVVFILALAAMGSAVPAMASAAPVLTMPATSLVPIGTLVTATSSNWVFTWRGTPYKCTTNVELRGKVAENSAASGIKLNSSGVATAATCNWPSFSHYEKITLSELAIKESGKGTATFSITLPVGETGCTWTAKNAPFTYSAGASSINFKSVALGPVPMACAVVEIDADFTLETTAPGSGLVVID